MGRLPQKSATPPVLEKGATSPLAIRIFTVPTSERKDAGEPPSAQHTLANYVIFWKPGSVHLDSAFGFRHFLVISAIVTRGPSRLSLRTSANGRTQTKNPATDRAYACGRVSPRRKFGSTDRTSLPRTIRLHRRLFFMAAIHAVHTRLGETRPQTTKKSQCTSTY
jgi:hypothetical protein